MIINTGMRTDIPAFYSEWFANRLRAGFVCTRNPYNPHQVTKYTLSPDVVDVIVFCTKNPAPMFRYMELLKRYGQYWFVTITPYGEEIEPRVPPKENVIVDFKHLSEMVGADAIGWRYDPIFVSDTYSVERHIEEFAQMASALAGYTHCCVISFIDLYRKVLRNFPEVHTVSPEDRITLGKEFVRIGKQHGMVIRPCAEGTELEPYGADCNGCMTAEIFERAIHTKLNVPKRKSQRPECNCVLGNDIGAYDTCAHLCKYCYANTDARLVERNRKLHNPNSPLLTGELGEDDTIHEAVQKRWRKEQLDLFDFM